MSWNLLGIGEVVEGVGKVADDLFTSDEERLKIAQEEKALEADLIKGQLQINTAEAQHQSVFVAGWRPFIGWVGGVALAYQFVLYPLLTWALTIANGNEVFAKPVAPPPVLEAEVLWVLISGMLGIAGMRSFDKLKGTNSSQIGKPG
jgi:hypothetical protein